MRFRRSVLFAAAIAAAACAPALAQEHEVGHWLPAVGAWRYAPPPAITTRPAEQLPTVEAIVDFVVRATDPANYRGTGAAGVAERGAGRYVFDVWLRGNREHSLVLVLPTSPEEAPGAWLVTRRVQQLIEIAELMRMVDRTLEWSRRDSAPAETGVTWRPLPLAPSPAAAPTSTGKEPTSSGAAFQPSFAGGVRVAVADVNGDADAGEKYFTGFVSRFAAGGRSAPPGPDPTRVDVKFPSLPPTGSGDSSNWVRMTQSHTVGSVVLPRVGWETQIHALPAMPLGAAAAPAGRNPGAGSSGQPGSPAAPGLTIRR